MAKLPPLGYRSSRDASRRQKSIYEVPVAAAQPHLRRFGLRQFKRGVPGFILGFSTGLHALQRFHGFVRAQKAYRHEWAVSGNLNVHSKLAYVVHRHFIASCVVQRDTMYRISLPLFKLGEELR